MSQSLINSIRGAAITACMEHGVCAPKDIRKILKKAHQGCGNMSIAGVRAAISKGQVVSVIDKMPADKCGFNF